jgi:hypothetical protein
MERVSSFCRYQLDLLQECFQFVMNFWNYSASNNKSKINFDKEKIWVHSEN